MPGRNMVEINIVELNKMKKTIKDLRKENAELKKELEKQENKNIKE